MTGGSRDYLPGIECVVRRLHALGAGSTHALPVLVAVPEPDAPLATRRLRRYPRAHVLGVRPLPSRVYRMYRGARWGTRFARGPPGGHVLDKLAVLRQQGAEQYERIVWIDADVLRRASHSALPHRALSLLSPPCALLILSV